MKHQEEKMSLRERVNESLSRNWKLAVVVLTLVVIAMASILVLDKVNSNREDAASMLAEDIQDAYIEWTRSAPGERDDEAVADLIEKALSEYPKLFAAQRAYFTKGLMALENEDWATAAESFETLAEGWKDSYLAPVSLFNAGSAHEQAGDLDAASADWQMLVDGYSDVSPDAPETLFNLGRVAEVQGNAEEAVDFYESIAAEYPESRWTDLAKSRILVIEG
jgi:tetratricopeptide (TPR) repeat protein